MNENTAASLENMIRAVRDALDQAQDSGDPQTRVASLAAAVAAAEAVLDEAMAQSMVAGRHSLREVADWAGRAPNTVRARLVRTPTLGQYSRGGVVDAQAVALARSEQSPTEPHPPRFTRRRSTT